MKIIDTVTDCTANDLLRATTQNSYVYVETKKLGYQITEVLKLCKHNNPAKISALTKSACTALGLPLDTKGGGKSPEHNVAIFEWLRDNKATTAISTDLPIIEPVAPAEIVNDDTTTAETNVDIAADLPAPPLEIPAPEITVDSFDIDTALETVAPSNQIVISLDTITEINSEHTLAQQTADKAIEHGKRVGVLLMQVKESLPHGDFLPWLIENVDVSERQAQRYMRNAKGLPAPIRTTGKTDTTVSYLNHDKAIKKIQNAFNTFDANNLPPEIMTEWQLANDAFNKIAQWIDLNAPLESPAITGTLVD